MELSGVSVGGQHGVAEVELEFPFPFMHLTLPSLLGQYSLITTL